MRAFHKSWQNKRPGWTHRVRWYRGMKNGFPDIRLEFTTPEGKVNLTYMDAEKARKDYDAFTLGQLNYWQLLEKKG